jgi:hypothetical protein
LEDEQLERYARGQLDSSQTVPLEEHLLMCSACQERLDSVGDFALAMKAALVKQPALEQSSGRAYGWFDWLRKPAFSMAIGFAALILVVAIFSNNKTSFVPSASLVLTAIRGEMPQTVAAREFKLTLSDAPKDGGPFRVEVVNATGGSVWSGLVASGPNGVQVTEPRALSAGDYFVRLYSADGKILREYGFRVRS